LLSGLKQTATITRFILFGDKIRAMDGVVDTHTMPATAIQRVHEP
jgi:hypothetical protein